MTITFDNIGLTEGSEFYKASTQVTSDLNWWDYNIFTLDSAVGDAMVWGYGASSRGFPWHDLYLEIDIPLDANVTYEWFSTGSVFGDPSGWNPLTITNDGTNGFTQSGWIEFDTPDYFIQTQTHPGLLSFAIKCVLTSVTSITTLGHINDRAEVHDWTITITSEETMTSIKAANDSAGWGVVDQDGSFFKINASLYILGVDASIISLNETVHIGDDIRARRMYLNSGTLQLGDWNAGDGVFNGSYWEYQSQSYNYPVSTWTGIVKLYNSKFRKRSSSSRDGAIGSTLTMIDSTLHFDGTMNLYCVGGIIKDSILFSPSSLAINTGYLTFDNVLLRDESANFWMDLRGQPNPIVSNIDFTKMGIGQVVVYGNTKEATATFIDCTFLDVSTQINNYNNGTAIIKFNLSLELLTADGSSLSDCNVKIVDALGSTIFDEIYLEDILLTTHTNVEENGVIERTDYSPFTMEITKDGYETYESEFNLIKKSELIIALTEQKSYVYLATEKLTGKVKKITELKGIIKSNKSLTGTINQKEFDN